MPAQKYKEMVNETKGQDQTSNASNSSNSSNSSNASNSSKNVRSRAVGENVGQNLIAKVQRDGEIEGQMLLQLKALTAVSTYNNLQQNGEYFEILARAFDANNQASYRTIEAQIQTLIEEEKTLPKLLSGSTESSVISPPSEMELNTLETSLEQPVSNQNNGNNGNGTDSKSNNATPNS
jgi:hypothetical protein